ncbi:MAG: sugar transferase, partial [Campylobacterota bacterium]|nr:sugar transferase [Campylobacterota bacterium]
GSTAEELREMISQEIDQKHEVIFIPLIDDYDLTQSQIYELSNTRNNLIVFQNRLKSRYRTVLKYFSDFLLAIILLPFLVPILSFIALLIKKDEADSPVLFNQERMGKNEVPFVCYKFRTMKCDSDAMLQSYLKDHPEEVVNYEKYHKYENDPRVTKIGKFLRKTSLDELPQIFNVLKGEMSFVGPRPYMLDEKDQISDRLGTVLTVKPGITGLWQVSGRSDVDFKERVEMDVWYIRNWNLWLDFVILLKTLKTVLLRKGAS